MSLLFSARHFGTGVLIATAFVHLLPTAFISLGDQCLSGFWTNDYPAMPGAIALGAIFLVTVVEMVFSPAQHICRNPRGDQRGLHAVSPPPRGSCSSAIALEVAGPGDSADPPEIRPSDSATDGNLLFGDLGQNGRLDQIEFGQQENQTHHVSSKLGVEEPASDGPEISSLTPEQKHKKAVMQCMLLEMGILFHSVFIGMALSVSIGNDFVVLLIAITFHRTPTFDTYRSDCRSDRKDPTDNALETFEGLALGSRIASLAWRDTAIQPWLMALAYGCTYVFQVPPHP